jgi:ribonuclease E
MTVVDVNTGKYTGSGGNLEETVTKNNLEAAEEVVRQLRLRDIGGIIVVDFIDMVLESNRDLVLRRLVECLGRDRTRHQVAEVTSLGLVQMTRKRIGTGLLESFSHECEHCHGRGVMIQDAPVEPKRDEPRRGGRGARGAGGGGNGGGNNSGGNNSGGGGNSGGGRGGNQGNGGNRGPKPVEPKAETPKADVAQPAAQQPTADAPTPDAPRAEAVQVTAPTNDAPQIQTPTVQPPKADAAAVEPPAEKPATTPRKTRKRGSATKPAGPPAAVESRPFDGGGNGENDPVLTSEGQAP